MRYEYWTWKNSGHQFIKNGNNIYVKNKTISNNCLWLPGNITRTLYDFPVIFPVAYQKIAHVLNVSIGRVIFEAWHTHTLDARRQREYFEVLLFHYRFNINMLHTYKPFTVRYTVLGSLLLTAYYIIILVCFSSTEYSATQLLGMLLQENMNSQFM